MWYMGCMMYMYCRVSTGFCDQTVLNGDTMIMMMTLLLLLATTCITFTTGDSHGGTCMIG